MMKMITLVFVMFTFIVASFTMPTEDQKRDINPTMPNDDDDMVMDGPGTEGSGGDMVMNGPKDDNDMDGPYNDTEMEGGCGEENTTEPVVPLEEVCNGKVADIAFLLDRSRGVNLEEWQQQLNFTIDLIKLFDMTKVKVEVISYAGENAGREAGSHMKESTARLIKRLEDRRSLKEFRLRQGERTVIYRAIDELRRRFFNRDHIRPGVPRVAVVMVNDHHHDGQERLQKARDQLLDDGDNVEEIFVIDIGTHTSMGHLKAIASQEENIVTASEWGGLTGIRDDMAHILCGDVFAEQS